MPSMPNVRDSSGTIGTTCLPSVLVAHEHLQDLHERHRRGDLALVGALEQALERRQLGHRQRRSALRRRCGQVAAELHAPRAHVLELGRAFGERDVGHLVELVVGDGNLEAVAEMPISDSCAIFFCWCVMFCASPDAPMP